MKHIRTSFYTYHFYPLLWIYFHKSMNLLLKFNWISWLLILLILWDKKEQTFLNYVVSLICFWIECLSHFLSYSSFMLYFPIQSCFFSLASIFFVFSSILLISWMGDVIRSWREKKNYATFSINQFISEYFICVLLIFADFEISTLNPSFVWSNWFISHFGRLNANSDWESVSSGRLWCQISDR